MRGSTFRDTSINFAQLLKEEERNMSPDSRRYIDKVKMMRIEDAFPEAVVSCMFQNINPDDILPPKYFPEHTLWKVLKHLATNKKIINSLFINRNDRGKGQYSVYLDLGLGNSSAENFFGTEIDSTVPVIENEHGDYSPAFINLRFAPNNIPDLWPLLMEKAIVKATMSLRSLFEADYIKQYSLLRLGLTKKLFSENKVDDPFNNDLFDISEVRSVQ
jgi:hypothetical protein